MKPVQETLTIRPTSVGGDLGPSQDAPCEFNAGLDLDLAVAIVLLLETARMEYLVDGHDARAVVVFGRPCPQRRRRAVPARQQHDVRRHALRRSEAGLCPA